MKARIDLALAELEEIPRLFDSEDYMRHALTLPQARIREIVKIRDRYGPDAQLVPESE